MLWLKGDVILPSPFKTFVDGLILPPFFLYMISSVAPQTWLEWDSEAAEREGERERRHISGDTSKIEWTSVIERQLADLVIPKHKLVAIHSKHTHAGRDAHTLSDNCVSDFLVSQRQICRPKRNKQICHFPLFSKTESLSIKLMCHILSVWVSSWMERKQVKRRKFIKNPKGAALAPLNSFL